MDQESESFQILAVDMVRKSKNRARPQHTSANFIYGQNWKKNRFLTMIPVKQMIKFCKTTHLQVLRTVFPLYQLDMYM